MYNVALRRVPEKTVAWKSDKYYVYCVCVCVCVCVRARARACAALLIQHAKRMSRIILSVSCLSVPYSCTLSHTEQDFWKRIC
jgi:hypothetical protein